MKNVTQMRDLMSIFMQNNIDTLFPDLDFKVPDSGMTLETRKELQNNHFSKIRLSDVVYVLTPDKHIGRMVTIEIGYAKALGKKIIFSQKTDNMDLDMFADNFLNVKDLMCLYSMDVKS